MRECSADFTSALFVLAMGSIVLLALVSWNLVTRLRERAISLSEGLLGCEDLTGLTCSAYGVLRMSSRRRALSELVLDAALCWKVF